MPPKKAADPTPTLTEVRVSYSTGVKCNLNRRDASGKVVNTYESADYHLSEAETWGVEGMTDEQVQEFLDKRRELLREKLDEQIESLYNETSFFGSSSE